MIEFMPKGTKGFQKGHIVPEKKISKSSTGRIEAHHILPWSNYPELRYEINNGISLCHFHHPRKKNDEIKLAPMFNQLVLTKV